MNPYLGYCTRNPYLGYCTKNPCLGYCTRNLCLGYCTRNLCLGYCTRNPCWYCTRNPCLGYCTRNLCLGYCTRNPGFDPLSVPWSSRGEKKPFLLWADLRIYLMLAFKARSVFWIRPKNILNFCVNT